MENDAVMLYCPNCSTPNPLNHNFCQQCSTPLPKRYLWAINNETFSQIGRVLADRYLIVDKCVVLDTKPGLSPQSPQSHKEVIKPYLKLFAHRLNIPQIYGVIPSDGQSTKAEIILLEQPAIDISNSGEVKACSQLTTAWQHATSMRQLNWLWQIANLWQPLNSQRVGSSLIDPELLRVQGSLVRLLELRVDSTVTPDLSQLGEFWQKLQSDAQPPIADFVGKISQLLINRKIASSDLLVATLDQALTSLARSQAITSAIVTKTDTGPRRKRNEDACHPPSGTFMGQLSQSVGPLVIVCDGIGGHQGGDVASNLAITSIEQELQSLTQLPHHQIQTSLLLRAMDSATKNANDKISQVNDQEGRYGRERMGTTLVMALPVGHQMYITHVGDSRVYWITRNGCYQVTLDDDVASRDVRLGYSIYRDAVQSSTAGALIQALGVSSSESLYPSSQRFVLDEDGIFLLTSDGLTDFDRVEDYWQTEILPILTGDTNLVTVAEKLVEIGNTKNGHDNVTVGLIHYQVNYTEPDSTVPLMIPEITPPSLANTDNHNPDLADTPVQKTEVISGEKPSRIQQLPLHLIFIIILLILAGSIGVLVMNSIKKPQQRTDPSPPTLGNPMKDSSQPSKPTKTP